MYGRDSKREREGDRRHEYLLCLKSIVGTPVVQVMTYTTNNKR